MQSCLFVNVGTAILTLRTMKARLSYAKRCGSSEPMIPTIMDKFIQRFIFQLTFYHIFGVLLQPSPSIQNSVQGHVSRKSRKRFGPEKTFITLRSAYSVKLVFSYVLNGIKIIKTAKFRASRRAFVLKIQRQHVTQNAHEKFPNF